MDEPLDTDNLHDPELVRLQQNRARTMLEDTDMIILDEPSKGVQPEKISG